MPSMSPDVQALAARGIATFAPNVRDSSGFGKAFERRYDGPKRVDGVRDIKATTDALIAMGVGHPERLGFAHTELWLAAISTTDYGDPRTLACPSLRCGRF